MFPNPNVAVDICVWFCYANLEFVHNLLFFPASSTWLFYCKLQGCKHLSDLGVLSFPVQFGVLGVLAPFKKTLSDLLFSILLWLQWFTEKHKRALFEALENVKAGESTMSTYNTSFNLIHFAEITILQANLAIQHSKDC